MARHPSTEGSDLNPNRLDAQEDVTVPNGSGGRRSLRDFNLEFSEEVNRLEQLINDRADLAEEVGLLL